MKWLALALLIAAVPLLFALLRSDMAWQRRVAFLLGLSPFMIGAWHLIIAPVSWAFWPGFVKGFEVSIIDAIAVSVFIALPPGRRSPYFNAAWVFYIGAVVLSSVFAGVPAASLFYAWQLARCLLVMAAIKRLCRDADGWNAVIMGMVAGLCLQAVFSLEARFSGEIQAGGTFGNQNMVGMVSHFAYFLSLALMLSGRSQKMIWVGTAGVLAGLIIAVTGASRATIGLILVGSGLLIVGSLLLRATPRKAAMILVALLAVGVATPLAMSSLAERFAAQPLSGDYDERAAFERAASMMLADHPMGVGANQYVTVANTQGYSERAGVVWNTNSRGAHVHNVYSLIAAETGYLGLIAFIALFVAPIVSALRGMVRHRRDQRGDLLLALGVTCAVVAIHSFYEWIFVTYAVQTLFAMTCGLIVALSRAPARGVIKSQQAATPADNAVPAIA